MIHLVVPFVAAWVLCSALASGHAILYKRDVRAAIGWTGFVWLFPFGGALVYLLFGINRIQRKATALRGAAPVRVAPVAAFKASPEFARVGDRIVGQPMTTGNRVTVHTTGESAFRAMLGAIESSRRSITLLMYIFELNATGRLFVDALSSAATRGVDVRVLIDAVGSREDGRRVVEALRARGVPAARFLPPRIPGMSSLNLRNHRKLLVVDGATAFTGGMNIADGYAGADGVSPIRDTAFTIEGPVVHELQDTFARDWGFTTGEWLDGEPWFVEPGGTGAVAARVLADGPDESFELARWVMLGAIASARDRLRIVTPYFVPDPPFIYALNVAALRGVRVEIFIPEVLDHRFVKWASNAFLWQVLEKGCRVWFTPPPFDHSKLCTADGVWACFGSSNWDNRSIRLNFELNVEVFDAALTGEIDRLIDLRRAKAREITLAEVDGRSIPVRLRDGVARLMAPYL